MDRIAALAASRVADLDGVALLAVANAALDRFAACDTTALHDPTLIALVEGWHRTKDRCHAAELVVTAEIDRRGLYVTLGQRSTADALADRLGMSLGDARRQVDVAEQLEDLPTLADAFAKGDVDGAVAAAAAEAAKDLPPAVRDRVDVDLAAAGRGIDKTKVKDKVDQARHDHDPSLNDSRDAAARKARKLTTWTRDGVGFGRWQTDLASHAQLTTILDAFAARDRATTHDSGSSDSNSGGDGDSGGGRPVADDRTPEQRRLDALTDVANAAVASLDGRLPDLGGLPARVWVHTSTAAQAYQEGSDAPTIDGAGTIGPNLAEILLCDGDVLPVRFDGNDVTVGTVPGGPVTPRQRTKVIARDRTCIGCGRRATSCQVHHIAWRARDGGTNDLTNLALVCWDCHHRIHHDGWTVTRTTDGTGRYTLARPTDAERRRRAA